MARSANQPDDNDQNKIETTEGQTVEAQPNRPADSPLAPRQVVQSDDPSRPVDDGQPKDEPQKVKQPSEVVVTTTDNEGNQVTLPTSHTGAQQVVNGPGEAYNADRPGVSPDWPAAQTNDQETEAAQNDGVDDNEKAIVEEARKAEGDGDQS